MEKSLRDLLAKLPIPGLKESNERHCAAEILSTELSLPITPSQITIKENTLSVSVPPVIKSALRIKEKALIERFSKEGISIIRIR